MSTLTPISSPDLDRGQLAWRYRRNRDRSQRLFSLIDPSAYFSRPVPLRHPFVFYEGHLPAFSFLTLNERALGETRIDARMETLFERGIDPGSIDAAQRHERGDWPAREDVMAFGRECDERVTDAIATAAIVDPSIPRLVRGQAVYTILEHEQMHHETLMYIIHQLANDKKHGEVQIHRDTPAPPNDLVSIPFGRATLGANLEDLPFGWDNEFGKYVLDVKPFAITRYPVTNGDWLAFIAAGGDVPIFWIEREGAWFLRCAFEEIPLPNSWPVYVSHDQADAYARWKGMRLPTEAEYHRAAFGSANGKERAFPWGDEAPSAQHGNFDFQRYDPEPVDAHPQGMSSWGVHDLVGNGWEWTSSAFTPFPGFAPMASYPQYSADFFDGKHYVMKGASPVTAKDLIRRSFRNWFYSDYPYMYAKFRCVST